MAVTGAFDVSLAAIGRRFDDLERVARRVAVDPLGDPARDAADLILLRAGVRASAAVVRAASEAEETLLDLFA